MESVKMQRVHALFFICPIMVVLSLVSVAINVTLTNTVCKTECTCVSDRCCTRDTKACPNGDQCSCKHVINDWSREVCEDADRSCTVNPDIFFTMFLCFFMGNFVLFPLFALWQIGTDVFHDLKHREYVAMEVEEVEAVNLSR